MPMSYLTQGTVQVERVSQPEGKVSVVISPIPDYGVKHKEKDYIVFMPASGPTSLVYEKKTTPFTVTDDCIIDILIKAAVNGTNVEIEIKGRAAKTEGIKIIAVKIPATHTL